MGKKNFHFFFLFYTFFFLERERQPQLHFPLSLSLPLSFCFLSFPSTGRTAAPSTLPTLSRPRATSRHTCYFESSVFFFSEEE